MADFSLGEAVLGTAVDLDGLKNGFSQAESFSKTGWAYHLGDALGSVRQLADSGGDVTLARSYEPFGVTLTSDGTGSSVFQWDGEMKDETGLTFLRARYVSTSVGRFISRDPRSGDTRIPGTLNRWNFVSADPINKLDPSGMIEFDERATADGIVQALESYGVKIEKDWGEVVWYTRPHGRRSEPVRNSGWGIGNWTLTELQLFQKAIDDLATAMGGPASFKTNIGETVITRRWDACGRGCTYLWSQEIAFGIQGNRPTSIKISGLSTTFDKWTVVHEYGHAWDRYYHGILAAGLEAVTGGRTSDRAGGVKRGSEQCDVDCRLPGCNKTGYFYAGIPPAASDNGFNRVEDIAESVAAYVYPMAAQHKVSRYLGDFKYGTVLYYPDFTKTQRWSYINDLLNGTIRFTR